jgi:hypothetical protein
VRRIELEAADDGVHRHRLTKTGGLRPAGDVVSATQALSQRLRPAPRARAVQPARSPRAALRRVACRRGRFRHPRPLVRPDHRLPLPAPPVRRRRLGRLPLAVPLQHRRLPADHGAGSQSPPVHQTFGARNFVVCSFVPRKFDYHQLAIPAPYSIRPASRTDRIRARPKRQSAGRPRRSWRSWSTRSTRSGSPARRPSWTTRPIRSAGCHPRGARQPAARRKNLSDRGPEAFPD